MTDLLHAIRAALTECDRYAYEARARALRHEGTSHAHYMGHAAGLDHAARIVEGVLRRYENKEIQP